MAWLGAGLVGVAGAQDPDDLIGELEVLQDPGEETLDTDRTPVAKPSEMWQLAHGTRFERTEPIDGSVTGFDVDLYAVALRSTSLGYAGGSRCADPPAREPGESDAGYGARVSGCERVPVMYRFTETAELGEVWEEVDLPGGDRPGFVGEIEWIDSERALAVGGDGRYPRRELARQPGESFQAWAARDPAGGGRAWLLEDGSWGELDLSRERAEGMRGMTALAFHPTSTVDFGVAGALGQVWHWESGRFTRGVGHGSPSQEMFNSALFRGRVRDLRFIPGTAAAQAFGVTSGCCEEDESRNIPRLLAFDGAASRWYVRAFLAPRPGTDEVDELREGEEDPVNPAPELPDSLYGIAVPDNGFSGRFEIRVLGTPGGPPGEGERPSVISDNFPVGSNGFFELGLPPPFSQVWTRRALGLAVMAELSTLRLVAAEAPPPASSSQAPQFSWLVGELRSTELEGLGAQGVARATHLEREAGVQAGTDDAGMPFVDDEDRALHPLRALVYRLPSYAVNGIDVVDGSGRGWAVGDRGALVRLSETEDVTQQAGAEPAAPRVGRPRESELTDTGPFEGFRPIGEDIRAGAVPPLHARPRMRLSEPRFEPAGDPAATVAGESVREIVMSRDGSEGWAVGAASGSRTTLHRFADGRWRRCEIAGSAGRPADPACAGIRDVLLQPPASPGGAPRSTAIRSVARVPLERDGDPSTDDDFEAVAVGATYNGTQAPHEPLILRYRDGRWRHEDPRVREAVQMHSGTTSLDMVAFTAPDDGWAVGSGQRLFRYDGERWVACAFAFAGPGGAGEQCDDPERRLPGGGALQDRELPQPVLEGLLAVGERTYAFGHRLIASGNTVLDRYPLILYRDRGGRWDSAEGGYDPAGEAALDGLPPDPMRRTRVSSLAVVELEDGSHAGWAVGAFGSRGALAGSPGMDVSPIETPFMRLRDGEWERFADDGPARDYIDRAGAASARRHVALLGEDGTVGSVFAHTTDSLLRWGRIFGFRDDAQRFEVLDSGRQANNPRLGQGMPMGGVSAMAPDGEGGAWAALGPSGSYFMHYTDRPHEPVFSEVPSPLADGRSVTSIAGAGDGSVWLSSGSDSLYRYDRLTGWDRVRVPGWDSGTVVTRPSVVHDVAVTPDGRSGVAVGEGGRIARLSGGGAVLDRAAGRACDLADPSPPCSTGRDLRAVDVAPDGSAVAAGDRLALLWRPAGGQFGAIGRPQAAASTDITGVSMPRPDRVWLATSTGRVFRGTLSGGRWSWVNEALDGSGSALSRDEGGRDVALRDVAIDAAGRGYAVGDRGMLLERTGDGERPWRRAAAGVSDHLLSVTLPAGGGEGALIGGQNGLVLSLVGDRFEVARHADHPGMLTGPVVGVAMLPGVREGQTEAWAALQGASGTSQLLHYASDPEEVLLSPEGRVEAVPDAPAHRPGEIAFAALGKSECRDSGDGCMEMSGTMELFETIARRSVIEIAERNEREGGSMFSVFTGDAINAAERRRELAPGVVADPPGVGSNASTERVHGALRFRRWRELVADRMERQGVPLLGTVGAQDLFGTHSAVRAGDNLAWREAFAGRRGPWGDGSDADLADGQGVSFQAVAGSPNSIEGQGLLGGANTHYAVDVMRGGKAVMRLAFADTSLRSLAVSDAQQQPAEPEGGQTAWLERVLCRRPGTAPTGEACTRPRELPAVVVTNTPTYSHGPGAATETMMDAAAFEAVLMRHRVSAAVAGRLGWNARYWATAPGLHHPCPGGGHQDEPPRPGASACGEATPGAGNGSVPQAPGQAELVADSLAGAGAPAPPGIDPGDPGGLDPEQIIDSTGADAPVSLLPFVVASGAGGAFANRTGEAREGFWHGYSIVRVPADGDPRGVIVEQRPVYDYVTLTALERRLRPGQRVTLRGYGRGPIASSMSIRGARFDRIDSDAVTHRYDLFEADPERPYVPRRDASGEYVPLDPEIATVDRETGLVRAGRGDHEQTFAVAVLSVGDKAASYPMVFEPRRSFRAVREQPEPLPVPTPQPPVPVPQVAGVPAAPPPPPPPPPPAPPPPSVSTPPFPALPALPSLGAPPAVGPPAAPAPPPTPPLPTPPSFSQAAPLGIAAEVGAIGVQGSVVPPSPPPVNPAPPGGSAARKEAKQRQAATAKSEEGKQEEGADSRGDTMADSPYTGDQAMTRHHGGAGNEHAATARDPDRPAPSFTATSSEQPSAWARGLLYGAGLGGAALILALGASTLRPTPRRRSPPEPAPAWARRR